MNLCTRNVLLTSVGLCAVCAGGAPAAPPSYSLTNITGWNAQQLATLPLFKHSYPAALPIANAPADFHFAARAGSGYIVGSTWNVFSGPDQRGALLTPGSATIIDSFGDFHWWRTSPPASATFRVSNAFDVNWTGVVVGLANLPGTSQTSSQTPDLHPVTFSVDQGLVDLVPDCQSGRATCVNNRGEVAGYAYGGTSGVQGGFRRSPQGEFTVLDGVPPGYMPTPLWINANGVVVGMSVPGGWASWEGSSVFPLPRLFGMPLATVSDVNDAGWIVGTSESWDHTEYYATLWEPDGAGAWTARDLTDIVTTGGILLDRAVAINNDGKILSSGHTDSGTPVYGTFLLTPGNANASSCVPDIGRHPSSLELCGTPAVFSVQVVNATGATVYRWYLDGVEVDGAGNPSAHTATLTIASPSAGDAGSYECVVTNACGATTSNAATLTLTCGLACDGVDFNQDGLFPDTADIDDFLSVFSGGACGTGACGDIDFNNDGLFPDTLDIDSLLSVFSGGACLG
ncbi:MAG: hypothetical protein U0637_14560 [Phycisphaerales bacterium]